MSDISTEITRLQNAKSKLIEFGNTFCPKLFDSANPITIDNIAEALTSFASKITGAVIVKTVSNSVTLQPLITAAETQERPVVIFVAAPAEMVQNLSAIPISQSCGAVFVKLTNKFSYQLGNYNISESKAGDIYIINPFTLDAIKANFSGVPDNVVS